MTIAIVVILAIATYLLKSIFTATTGKNGSGTGYGESGVDVYKDNAGVLRSNIGQRKLEYYENLDGDYEYIYQDTGKVYQSSLMPLRMSEVVFAKNDPLKTVIRWDRKPKTLEIYDRHNTLGVGYRDLETQRLFVIRKIVDCYFYMDVESGAIVRRTDGEIKREWKCKKDNAVYQNAKWKEWLDNEKARKSDQQYCSGYGFWLLNEEEEKEWQSGNEQIVFWEGDEKAYHKRAIECNEMIRLIQTTRIPKGFRSIPAGYRM